MLKVATRAPAPVDGNGSRLVSRGSEIGNERFHLRDFANLRFDDAVRQLSHPWISDMGAFADHDRNRVMRYHRFHVNDVVNRILAANSQSEPANTTTLPATMAAFAVLFLYIDHMNPIMMIAMAAPISRAIQVLVWL